MGTNKANFVKRLRVSNSENKWNAWDPDEDQGTGTVNTSQRFVNIVVGGAVLAGVQAPVIRVPFKCKINGVYAVLNSASNATVRIQIQRCSQTSINSDQTWQPILGNEITIDSNAFSSLTATEQSTLAITTLNANDHVRINVVETGTGALGLTVEMDVEVI